MNIETKNAATTALTISKNQIEQKSYDLKLDKLMAKHFTIKIFNFLYPL